MKIKLLLLAMALLCSKLSNAQTLSVSISGPSTLCSGNTLTLSATSPDNAATFSWSGPNGFTGTGSSVSISNADISASGTYYVTATDTTSASNPDSLVVVVNQTPNVYSVASQTLCNGANTASVNFSGSTATSTAYNWTNDNTSIGLAASNTGNIISFSAQNSTGTPAIANIAVTPTANGCSGSTQNFSITVNPTPSVNPTSGQVLCTGVSSTAITFGGSSVTGTTYNWTNNNTSIGLAASGSNNVSSFTSTNNTNTALYGTVTVVPTANGCSGIAESYTYVVYPVPTVTAITNQTLCSGLSTSSITFNGSVSGTTFNWANDNTSIGLASSGIDNITTFTATNTTSSAIVGNITVSPTANGCTGASQNFSFTVNPTPFVNSISNQTVCNGTSISSVSFTGSSIPGTTYNWVNNTTSIGLSASGTGNISAFNAANAASSAVSANITVTPTAGNCIGSAQSFAINVNPTPNVTLPTNQSVCNGANTSDIIFNGSVSGTSFNWANNNTSIGLSGTGTGTISAFTASNSSSTPVLSTISVTPTANGCTGTTQNFNISVNPIPSVSTVSDQALCSGTSFTQTTFTGSPVAGTTYGWTNNNTSIGLAANGSNSINAFTTLNNTGSPLNASITVVPSANGCNGSSWSFNVTVNPTPAVTAISNQTVCNGTNTTDVNFNSTASSTVFNWTNNTSSIGLANSGSGIIAGFTATNPSNAQVDANIVVTPIAYGCTGNSQAFDIYVNPSLTASVSINSNSGSSVCSGTNVVFTASPVNGGSLPTYSWQKNATTTGFGGSTFSASNFVSGDVITCIMTSNAPCTSVSTSNSITLTVNPLPTVDPVSSQEVCNGASINAITFTGSVIGATYNWTNTQTSIGLAATGSGNIASANVSNSSGNQVVSNITVTPVANGCSGTSQNFSIAVDPSVNPTVSISANPGTTICPATSVTFTAATTHGGSAPAYQWMKNGSNVGTNSSTYTDNGLSNSDVLNCVLTSNASCLIANTATSNNATIVLYSLPSISSQPTNSTVCTGNGSSFSVSAVGSGISYQWQVNTGTGFASISNGSGYSGATTGTLNIANASSAMNGYQYKCIVSGTCTPAATSSIGNLSVNTNPSILAQPTARTICPGDNTNFSISAQGTSLSYQWQVNTGSGFTTVTNSSIYGGSSTNTLTITGGTSSMNGYQYQCVVSGACSPGTTSNAVTLSLNSAPAITAQPSSITGCDGGNTSFTVGATGTGINSYQWLVNTGTGFVNVSDGTNYSGSSTNTLSISGLTTSMNGYQYKCTISGTCSPYVISNIAILSIGTAPAIATEPTNSIICPASNTTFTASATGTGLNYQWYVNSGSGFNPLANSALYSGATTNTLTLTGAQSSMNGYQYQCQISGTCAPAITSGSATLNLYSAPAISTQPTNITACENNSTNLSVAATGTALNYQWQVNAGNGFVNIYNGTSYSGTNSSALTISSVTANMSGYIYQCLVSGTCTPSLSTNSAVLTVNTLPSLSTQATASAVCEGGNTSYSVSATGSGLSYQWQANPGSGYANISDIGAYSGTGTNTLIISNATQAMDGYTFRCVVSGACTPSVISSDAALHVNILPAIATQPVNTATCNGANTSFATSAAGTGLVYQWQVNAGSGFYNVSNNSQYSGANSATLSITGAQSSMSNYQYKCIISGTCSPAITTSIATLSFNQSPLASITAAGPTTFCQGNSVTINANTGTNYTYQWLLNGSNVFGATNASIVASDGGNYTVAITNSFGCTTTSSSISVTANTTPSAPVNVLMGNLVFCAGNSVVLGTNTASGLTYQWQNNGVSIAGATNVTYTATTAGNYSVVVATNNCNNTSAAVNVVVNAVPSGNITTNNPPVICSATGSLLISSVAVSGQTYQWYKSGLAIPGANGSQISATTAGVYSVTITSQAGCITFSQPLTATYSISPAPVINEQNSTLNTDPTFASYQWYFNGNAISGANNATYIPTQDGIYTVTATNADGCSGTSAQFSLNDLGVGTVNTNKPVIKLYPNPVSSTLHIDASQNVNVSISDMQGRIILVQNNAKTIDMSQVPNGIYMVQVFNDNHELIATERLVKNAW